MFANIGRPFSELKNLSLILLLILLAPAALLAQGWPEIYNTDQLLTINLELAPADWQIVQNDEFTAVRRMTLLK